jgi:tetratricopeptide (TPR) repeat protein
MSRAAAVESLLFAALAKPTAAERAAFLDSACAGDTELRRQVEKLLKADARVGDFLQKPAAELLAAAAQPLQEPNLTTDHAPGGPANTDESHPVGDAAVGGLPAVPGYRVLREIARGGMGRVLAAYDHSLDRDVALKVLLPGANADRFVRESKITARLPHPGIPPVHALGTLADGSPFLAMKLIAGRTLAVEMKSADRARLLQAFTQVCQAVGFAHSRSIIHRDLKPANVMVGAFGEVQVMDWGLAKDLTLRGVPAEPRSTQGSTVPVDGVDADQTHDDGWPGESTDDQTKAGQVMGTPAYMAPEQARGEASDTRADVFALGGLLCAILTGQPPFTGKSTLEVIQRARAADLAGATGRLDGCGADAELVALCRVCLSPNPADRPADGQAVADALTAYLDGVQERLQTAQRERAVALAREAEQRKRRKVQLALAATVLLAVLGGAACTSLYLIQAEKTRSDEALRAAAERERQERNAEAVERLLQQAEEALQAGDAGRGRVLLEAVGKRAAEGGADELAGRRTQLQGDLAVLMVLSRFDLFRWTPVENKFPDLAAEAAWLHAALSQIGLTPESVPAAEAAARVSGSAVRDRLLAALDRWLRAERLPWVWEVLRVADSDDSYRNEVRDAVRDNDLATLGKLVSRKEAVDQPPGFTIFLAEDNRLPAEPRRKLLTAAVRNRPEELGLLLVLGRHYTVEMNLIPGPPDERLRWFQAAVGVAHENSAAWINLADALRDKGQAGEAIACYHRALAIDPKLAVAHNNLGQVLAKEGPLDEAIDCFHKAIEFDPKLTAAHINLGDALCRQSNWDEAIDEYHKAIKPAANDARTHFRLGDALAGKSQMDEAIAEYREAIKYNAMNIAAEKSQHDPLKAKAYQHLIMSDVQVALVHKSLGDALKARGQLNEAMDCWRRAVQLDPTLVRAHFNLGVILGSYKRDYDAAIACFRRAIELEPKFALAHEGLGTALKSKGQMVAAIACYQDAIKLDPNLAGAHYNLGTIYCDHKRDYEAAISCFRQATELNPKFANAYFSLGIAQSRLGQVDEVITSCRQAVTHEPKLAEAHVLLSEALLERGRYAEAREATARALELLSDKHPHHADLSQQLRTCERLAKLEGRIPRLLKGEDKAASALESLDFSVICHHKQMNAAAARFFADAYAADPRLGDDPQFGRYFAACSATLAAAGKGEDAAKLDDRERARLRKQALDWLRADLALHTKLLESPRPDDRAFSEQVLMQWKEDRVLAGLRDVGALAKLPAEDRVACEKLWADVATLLKKAATPAPKDDKR